MRWMILERLVAVGMRVKMNEDEWVESEMK